MNDCIYFFSMLKIRSVHYLFTVVGEDNSLVFLLVKLYDSIDETKR